MIRPSVLREDDTGISLGGKAAFGRKPNSFLQGLLREYVKEAGLPPLKKTEDVAWDPARCKAIAREFDRLPVLDDSEFVQDAYRALADEVQAQFTLLSKVYAFEPYGDAQDVPYRDSADMMDDVARNRHLFVYEGGDDHAILSREENWMFRAVHDLFGHASWGYQFGPRGEENAWVEHSKAFTPLARAALTTETRGQNSVVNCGPHSHLPVKERPFADQKGALLPEEYWTHPAFEEAYKNEPEFVRL